MPPGVTVGEPKHRHNAGHNRHCRRYHDVNDVQRHLFVAPNCNLWLLDDGETNPNACPNHDACANHDTCADNNVSANHNI